jgi:hypothetical protein
MIYSTKKVTEDIPLRGKDALFENGEIFTAINAELDGALMELSTGFVPNDMVRHREIIRAITINTIKSQRHIDQIEAQNQKLTYIIIILTVVSVILSLSVLFFK